MNKILIVTGKINTGKTNRLMKWVNQQKNIDGILQPVVVGKRFLYHISSKTLVQLETDKKENNISIGNYNFSSQAFNWAKEKLKDAVSKNLDYLIIDEIGSLELNGKGIEPTFTEIISHRNDFLGKIVCVVREEIFDKFLLHYNISHNDYKLLTIE